MKVSVVIPVYNRLLELQRAISSVLKQTEQDFEILVVDDYSENDLKSIVASYNDVRIKNFRLEKKGNANVCRNLGIKEALGEYIAMLDSDDEWLPNHLEVKINLLNVKNADGIFGSMIVDKGDEQKDVISRPFHKGELMVNYLLSDGWAPTPTHFYKAECAKQIMWDESLVRHQDWDFSVRFSKKFKFIPSFDLTCIVHWQKGERRAEHFDSLIKFIDNNKLDIDPILYSKYHRGFYTNLLTKPDVEEKYKQHYKRESLKYIDVISLRDFLGTFGNNKSKLYRFYLRIEFAFRILFK